MKRFLQVIVTVSVFCFSACKTGGNSAIESVVHVWGNCEKCKTTIESSCNISGVKKATWDVDTKLLTLTLDTNIVSLDAVLQSVSKSGYDSEKYFANDYAYDNLPQCCQYERRPFDSK